MFWIHIRIRIESGFNGVCESGSRKANMTLEKEKEVKKCFCSVVLDVLVGGGGGGGAEPLVWACKL